ncbi:ABC transporter ATP-binding protein [Euzebya pacifica]|uniref:ABC transporter ATP-binding protein n=1 Tax=Euzebya pacifica TaxID=1608957 RepID=UPI0030F83F98
MDADKPSPLGAPLLEVANLDVAFATAAEPVHAVRNVSWTLEPGETLVILGESGSGKSVSVHAAAGLLASNGAAAGSIRFRGEEVLDLGGRELRRFKAESYGMIFQDPMRSLDPCFTVGDQIAEIMRVHRGTSRKAAWDRAVDLLATVRIDDPARRAAQFPHELSGGMRQRVMIAMAIALEPPLLLADEPTTALDTSVRGAVLEIIVELREQFGMGVVLITHDIGVAAAVADRVAVMYAGSIVEQGTAAQVLHDPAHPYTAALLGSLPRFERLGATLEAIPGTPPNAALIPAGCAFHTRCAFATDVCGQQRPPLTDVGLAHLTACVHADPLRADGRLSTWRDDAPVEATAGTPTSNDAHVVVEDLVKEYRLGLGRDRTTLTAVDHLSFEIEKGTTLGLVGESGSGKSTTAMIVAGLTAPTSGRVLVGGTDIATLSRAGMRAMRRQVQVVFQDPFSSMDPRMTIGQIIDEPLLVHRMGDKAARHARVVELLDLVGLDEGYLDRYAHQVSGGQAQRVSIARALALEPDLVILDEPVAALDLSIQAQILNLLRDLQDRLGLTYLFIGHDLAAVAYVSSRVAVMSKGVIVEIDDVQRIYTEPESDYTRSLLDAILDPANDLGRFANVAVAATSPSPSPTEEEQVCVPQAPTTR